MASEQQFQKLLNATGGVERDAVATVMHAFPNRGFDYQMSLINKVKTLKHFTGFEDTVNAALVTAFPEYTDMELITIIPEYANTQRYFPKEEPGQICARVRTMREIVPKLARETGISEEQVKIIVEQHPAYKFDQFKSPLQSMKYDRLRALNFSEDFASKHARTGDSVEKIVADAQAQDDLAEVLPRQSHTEAFVVAFKKIPSSGHETLHVDLLQAITEHDPRLESIIDFFDDSNQEIRMSIQFYDDLVLLREKAPRVASRIAHVLYGNIKPEVSKLEYLRKVLDLCHSMEKEHWFRFQLETDVSALLTNLGFKIEEIWQYIRGFRDTDWSLSVNDHVFKFQQQG